MASAEVECTPWGAEAPVAGDQSHIRVSAGGLRPLLGSDRTRAHGGLGHARELCPRGVAQPLRSRSPAPPLLLRYALGGLEGSDRLEAWRANVGEPVALDLAPPPHQRP